MEIPLLRLPEALARHLERPSGQRCAPSISRYLRNGWEGVLHFFGDGSVMRLPARSFRPDWQLRPVRTLGRCLQNGKEVSRKMQAQSGSQEPGRIETIRFFR